MRVADYRHHQRVLYILPNKNYQIESIDCLVITDVGDGIDRVMYPRTLMLENEKYVIKDYQIEKDLVIYKRCKFDPILKIDKCKECGSIK